MSKFDQGFKDLHPGLGRDAGTEVPRPFHVSVQFAAESLLRQASVLMANAFELSKLQADIMHRVRELQIEVRALSRLAQADASRRKDAGRYPDSAGV